MKLKEHLEKFDESMEESLGESPKPFAVDDVVSEVPDLFASVESLERVIQGKDTIIESLKNKIIKLMEQVSMGEDEKSTILEELEQSRWLKSKVSIATKRVYEDKVKSIVNENRDSKIIPLLTAVARKKQGNQQLTFDNWLKIPENRYLFQINEDIAKGMFGETNNLIERRFENESVRGGGVETTTTTIYGLEFDGLTNEVTTTFSGGGATPINRTYSWWMKSSETARNYSVFSHGSQKRGGFTTNFSNGRVLMWNGNAWYTYWDDTPAQDDGEWHHWMVYNDVAAITGSTLYVDGTLQDVNLYKTTGTVSNLLTHNQSLTIGSYQNNSNNTSRHFEGSITNFAVYSGDKTDDASAHYNGGIPKDLSGETDLEGYWKMGEGKGLTVTDQSGEGNDGTINGASWVTITEVVS